MIELENCISYNDTLGITCMNDTEAYSTYNNTSVLIETKYKQIDMKN